MELSWLSWLACAKRNTVGLSLDNTIASHVRRLVISRRRKMQIKPQLDNTTGTNGSLLDERLWEMLWTLRGDGAESVRWRSPIAGKSHESVMPNCGLPEMRDLRQ